MMRILTIAAAVLCITGQAAEAKKKIITHHKARHAKPVANSPVAKEIFGHQAKPAAVQARAIGSYARGCLAGAQPLPVSGPAWQAMRLSRNRNWGHPALLKYLERLATDTQKLDGWPGLLVGDLSQPMGGPMLTGHASHQIGLDADIWLKPMPAKTLSPEERETEAPVSMLAADGLAVDPAVWTLNRFNLIKRAASYAQVARIFVHPAIKKALCEGAGIKFVTAEADKPANAAASSASAPPATGKNTPAPPDKNAKAQAKAKQKGKAKTKTAAQTAPNANASTPVTPELKWLAKVRPYWGHHYHFHVRLSCPPGMAGCENQPPLPGDLGCGKELESWLKLIKGPPKPEPTTPPVQKHPLTMADLPVECSRLVGFDPKTLATPVPMGAGMGTPAPLPERKPVNAGTVQPGTGTAAAQPQPSAQPQPAAAKPVPPLPASARASRAKHSKAHLPRAAKAATFTPANTEPN